MDNFNSTENTSDMKYDQLEASSFVRHAKNKYFYFCIIFRTFVIAGIFFVHLDTPLVKSCRNS